MNKSIFLGVILALGAALVACTGKDGKVLGAPVPADAEKTTIEAVLKDTARYAGRVIAIEGQVGGIGCADCGGVLVTDKTWRMLVEPEDKEKFKIEPRPGARIRAWGVLGVEASEGEKKPGDAPAEPKTAATLELKARGVEWL